MHFRLKILLTKCVCRLHFCAKEAKEARASFVKVFASDIPSFLRSFGAQETSSSSSNDRLAKFLQSYACPLQNSNCGQFYKASMSVGLLNYQKPPEV